MLIKKIIILLTSITFTCGFAIAQESSHKHKHEGSHKVEKADSHSDKHEGSHKARSTRITGEAIDIGCYVGKSEKEYRNAACIKACLASGAPAGIKTDDGTIYLVVGADENLKKSLSDNSGEKATYKGTVLKQDGMSIIKNAVLEK